MHTVLYVEDLENNRVLVRRILESQNYRVVEAVNGLEGIAKAIEVKPDIILMDINLPDLDGFSVVTRIRSEAALASIPIIAVTARNVEDDAERAKAIGCDSYLSKPFGVTELLQQVETHLAKPREKEDISRTEQYLREHSASLVGELERKFNELSAAHSKLGAMHERLQRLDEAKTDFRNVAAHELRTPLTMIHAYTDMLRTHPRLSGDETVGEMMVGLRKGVDRLNNIIQDMVSIVRVELSTMDLAYSPMPLRLIIQSVVKEVTATQAGLNNIGSIL
jgi:two-component system cell cycle response regulator DivK